MVNHYPLSKKIPNHTSAKRLKFFVLLCLLTYFFNCTDFLFTYTFLKTGYFYELNPLMQPILPLPLVSTMVKIILPGILLTFLLMRLAQTEPKLLKLAIVFSGLTTLFYMSINCMHIYYLFNIL